MAGNEQFVYPTKDLGGAGQFSGNYIESPDGTQLVLGTANLGNEIVPRTDNSLVVMANDGSIVRVLPAPMPKAMCSPVKWWAPDVILTHCDGEKGAGEQLWEVPLNGGKPTALTAVNTHDNAPGFQGNYGNWTAFQAAGSTFLPTAGACGTTFVSRLTPDGHTERVKMPGVSDSAGLAGVSGDNLVVVGQVGCGGGDSLVTYDRGQHLDRAARATYHQGRRRQGRPSLSEQEVKPALPIYRFTVLVSAATAFAAATASAQPVTPATGCADLGGTVQADPDVPRRDQNRHVLTRDQLSPRLFRPTGADRLRQTGQGRVRRIHRHAPAAGLAVRARGAPAHVHIGKGGLGH